MQISWSFEVKIFSLSNSPPLPLSLRAPDSFQHHCLLKEKKAVYYFWKKNRASLLDGRKIKYLPGTCISTSNHKQEIKINFHISHLTLPNLFIAPCGWHFKQIGPSAFLCCIFLLLQKLSFSVFGKM